MRKRLIESITKSKRSSRGYTLTELLTVIAIIAVVCAIAIPSIFAIRNALRFAQANNYAKSIFLAAQQNLTEMRSDGGLEPVLAADGAYSIPPEVTSFPDEFRTEYVYTYTGRDAFNCVLPVASVDATIRDDQIVIEYNPLTGNVYAVFYYDKGDLNLTEAYQNNLSRDKAERKKLMVGYYDGSGLNSSQIELEQTQAIVNFRNEQEGIVEVIVPMPESFYGKHGEFGSGLNITLGISGEQSMAAGSANPAMDLKIKTAADGNSGALSDDGQSLIFEYPIDSLVNRSSFANYASNTQASAPGAASSGASLTTVADESKFTYNILPGENITITATVSFEGTGSEMVKIDPGILSGVNPMFEYLKPADGSGYVLGISNGRNLQNLNAISPTIAKQVVSVVFTSDIYWNETVNYYNKQYGTDNGTSKLYTSAADEAPARALPHFVPIHSEALFGTASFEYGVDSWVDKIPDGPIKNFLLLFFSPNSRVPTLTDEFDVAAHAAVSGDDVVNGDAAQIYYLNIDTTKYPVGKAFYAGTATADNDRFTGLFSYVNTSIDNIHIVNPIVKGYKFTNGDTNNPATGALVGAAGYNTYISNCAVYLDKSDPGFVYGKMTSQTGYSATNDQTWYGISGEGAVGGLVGYAKSHRTTSGELKADKAVLAFYNSFAAVNVSGNLREEVRRNYSYYGYANKDYGYSNGIGGFIGNSQLTNFYNCYASGNVIATNTNAADTFGTKTGGIFNSMLNLFGIKLEFQYGGRESAGAGGFVGTSHGTRYTNCFATGTVTATASTTNKGASGFVGIMCIDETFAYGNQTDSKVDYTKIAQRTVFTNCYSVGLVTLNGVITESFSGANCRVAFDLEEFGAAQTADYYRLLGRHYHNTKTLPSYEDFYIFKDTYYLSKYYLDEEPNSNNCASPASYPTLQNLIGNHQNATWIDEQIQTIKNIKLYDILNLGIFTETYEEAYFDRAGKVEAEYVKAYKKGFLTHWEAATASSTHGYDLSGTYPFSKIKGLPFYGDWPAMPLASGIAYYEAYEKDTSGNYTRYYHFDRESTSNLKDASSISVIKDGYAILSSSNKTITITVNGVSKQHTSRNDRYIANNKEYHVYWLTDAQMAAAEAYAKQSGQFYVPVTVTQDGATHTFYFNPNVAKSQVNSAENHTYTASSSNVCTTCGNAADHELHLPISKEMLIRSARQFAQLSEMTNFLTSDYRYVQQLNIDASEYLWTDAENDIKVGSIGNVADDANDIKAIPFNASYTGLYIDETTLEEKQYRISGLQPTDAGLFGFIGQTGVVSDLIIECTKDIVAGTANTEDVAVLAGVTYGTVDNVDLNLTGNVTLTAKHCAALLAAHSTGKIVDCDVTVAEDKAVTITAPNAGGLIGTAQGTADVKTVLSNSNVTTGAFTVKKASKAGGIVGNAIHLTADKMNATLVSLTAETTAADSCVGGLAGYAEDSAFTGVVSAVVDNKTVNPVEITVSGPMSVTNGYAAGAIGTALNTTLTAVDASANGIASTNGIAAGYLGTGSNTDVSNSFVTVSGDVTGAAGAAGVAGTIGSQSVFQNVPVTLNNVKITASEGNAAGYALEIKGEADVYNSPVTLGTYKTKTLTDDTKVMQPDKKTVISAPKGDAAGYACVIDGSVGEDYVVGPAAISGSNASGFAVNVNGTVAQSYASPALTADAAGYLYNSNANLTVSGSTAAAGFALNMGEKGSINNSYTLCTITSEGTVEIKTEEEAAELADPTDPTEVTDPIDAQSMNVSAAYAFAGTNSGTINRCMANVDISGGFAFVGTNNGLVTTSYGWYNDADTTEPAAAMTGTGSCNNSYFADMTPGSRKDLSVTVYDKDAAATAMTTAQLQTTVIEGFSDSYRTMAYPYQEMTPSEYMYPMLRPHYGNWLTPPLYAYGVAYYEIYEDETFKIHVVDLSDSSVTEEGHANVTVSNKVSFGNTGKIAQTGYARFYNTEVGTQAGTKLDQLTYTAGDFTYDFYALEGEGEVPYAKTTGKSSSALIDVRFADAIMVNATAFASDYVYQVRTPAQLAYISKRDANYSQTHDITTTDVASASIGANRTYDGNDCVLTITNQANTWLTDVGGTVTDLTLKVDGTVAQPVFGSVTGTISLNSVTLGEMKSNLITKVEGGTVTLNAVSAANTSANLIGTVSGGTVTMSSVKTGAAGSNLFGTISGGTVTTGPITMASRGAALVGTFTGGTLQGGANAQAAITVNSGSDTIATALFANEVGGTVKNYTVAASGLTAKMVPTLSGTMDNVALTVNGDAGANVIDSLSGTAKNVSVSITGNASANVIATIGKSAENINVSISGNSTKSVIGKLSGTLNTANITVRKTLNAGVIGTAEKNAGLTGVTATVNTFSASTTGGVLVATNNTSITDCTLDVGTATINNVANFGLIAHMLPGDKTMSGTTATVGTLTVNLDRDHNVGGLVGLNNGTIQNSTVTANVQINGADGKHMIFGGLVGTNSGTIAVTDSSNVTVTYVQPDTTAATDKATIGGLVGIMSKGTLTDVIKTDNSESSGSETTKAPVLAVTGSISLNKDQSGANRTYVVGGAIGKITGGTASNLSTSVTVDAAWAKAANVEGNATFGTSGIVDNGPVGMYVGYAGTVSLTNCASIEKTNEKYQFVGEVSISSQTVDSDFWMSDILHDPLTTISEDKLTSGTVTIAIDENTSATLSSLTDATSSVNYVNTTLTNCVFTLAGENIVQTVGADKFFYKLQQNGKSEYTIGTPIGVTESGNQTWSRKVTAGDSALSKTFTGYYYKVSDTFYSKVYVSSSVKTGSSWGRPTYTYTFTFAYVDENGVQQDFDTKTTSALRDNLIGDDSETVTYSGLYALSSGPANGTNYLVVSGNRAVNGKGGESIENISTFREYNTLYNYIYACNGANLTKENESHVVAFSQEETMTASAVFSVGNLSLEGVNKFMLYPLMIENDAYFDVSFAYQNNTNYQRQFVSSETVTTN